MTRAALLAVLPAILVAAPDYWMYVGTYTTAGSAGIYVYRFDASTGRVTPAGIASGRLLDSAGLPAFGDLSRAFSQLRAEWPDVRQGLHGTPNPSFLAVHPSGRLLYASNENPAGSISAFLIEPTSGKLKLLDTQPSGGSKPSYVTVDNTGRFLLTSNFLGGSVAALPIAPDGSLGKAAALVRHQSFGAETPLGAHPHSIYVSPDNRYVLVPDLGLDRVFIYRFNSKTGGLEPNHPPFMKAPRGSGPRHLAFHPNGRFAYVLEELQSTITVAAWDASTGILDPIETVSTLPPGHFPGNGTAEIIVRSDGRFLYASNRGHDSIAVFAIDPATGRLAPVQFAPAGGRQPRNFRIDPTSRFLFAANTQSGNLVQFRIDDATGRLAPTGNRWPVAGPACIRFIPAGTGE